MSVRRVCDVCQELAPFTAAMTSQKLPETWAALTYIRGTKGLPAISLEVCDKCDAKIQSQLENFIELLMDEMRKKV